MLLVFEGTVVISRTRNLKLLHEMMGRPLMVLVFRNGVWRSVLSDVLLPGDIISVSRSKTDPDAGVSRTCPHTSRLSHTECGI